MRVNLRIQTKFRENTDQINTEHELFFGIEMGELAGKVKDTLKAFENFKKQAKKKYEEIFWGVVKVCIFWKCIQYTIPWDKIQVLKQFPSDKINGTKILSFSFVSSDSSVYF